MTDFYYIFFINKNVSKVEKKKLSITKTSFSETLASIPLAAILN